MARIGIDNFLLILKYFRWEGLGKPIPRKKNYLALVVDDKTVQKNCIASQNTSFWDSIGYDKLLQKESRAK